MAHITEINIEGLLGRTEPIHLKLNRGVNVFFGENGCGKTTLLKVLDAALDRDGAAMARLPVSKATVDIFSIEEGRVIRHSWDRGREQNRVSTTVQVSDFHRRELLESVQLSDGRIIFRHDTPETQWKLSPSRRGRTNSRWAHTFLPTTRLYFNDVSGGRGQASERELDEAFSESINKAWLQYYTKTLTAVRGIQESGLRTVLWQVLSPEVEIGPNLPRDLDELYKRVANFLARQSGPAEFTLGSRTTFLRRYQKDANLRRVVDNLDDVERQIELSMVPIDRFVETISKLFSRGKKLKITNNELQILLANDRAISISQLSSGEKHLIKILLLTMTAAKNSVIIDEPELSMHIDWQRIFVSTLHSLNPECQLILASHSPEIMADLPDEYIFKL
ncbi:MAG TPA: ATP-binding protein [Chthoniobacteraceae bacterium]|jgi:predicted ATPase|nr:ATP-binding protein [Chthoniobacteraceae bacterium]